MAVIRPTIGPAAESAGQSVGGVPVEIAPGPVVAAGGAVVGVPGEVLDVRRVRWLAIHVPPRVPNWRATSDLVDEHE